MKYMGSKDRLAKYLLPVILAKREHRSYCEPFAGGMNMIQHVPQGAGRYANDNNRFVVAFWLAFLLDWRPPHVTRAMYEDIRKGGGSVSRRIARLGRNWLFLFWQMVRRICRAGSNQRRLAGLHRRSLGKLRTAGFELERCSLLFRVIR